MSELQLTRKQKEVVKCMQETGGRVSEVSMKRYSSIAILVPDTTGLASYDVVMLIHPRVFKNLISKGVIKYMPQLTETRGGWHRSWYELADEYK